MAVLDLTVLIKSVFMAMGNERNNIYLPLQRLTQSLLTIVTVSMGMLPYGRNGGTNYVYDSVIQSQVESEEFGCLKLVDLVKEQSR